MIFFDIDDTLVTNSQSQRQAALLLWEAFAERLPHSKEQFPAVWDAVMWKHFATFAVGQISFREQRLRRMQEIFSTSSPALSDDEADALFQVYLQHYEREWALFDDVMPCLDALRHHRLGVISNGNGDQQRRKLRQLGIDERFEIVVLSEEAGVWKPDPGIFREACQQASEAPRDCFYVGDNLKLDALASQAAGMHGIWLNRDHMAASEAGVSVISGLNELVASV